MSARRVTTPTWVEVEGANGGSFVFLEESQRKGFCRVRVGHSCVITVDQDVPVTWLAAILTRAKDAGLKESMGDPSNFPADYALMCNPESEAA